MADADRALVPVVGKTLEAAIVVLYVAGLVATLHGGVLPAYRTATAAELGDRTLASAADGVEATVPPPATSVDATRTVGLPDTIDGRVYRIRADNGTLVLDHPDERLSGQLHLALPPRVVSVGGSWRSDEPAVVRVRGGVDGVRVSLA